VRKVLEIGCSISGVVRRVVVLLAGMGLLSGLDMPLSRPCCSLTELAASTGFSPDCCPLPDCCRGEKRGADPVVLSPKSVTASPSALGAAAFPVLALPSISLRAVPCVTDVRSFHGPPAIPRDLSIFLSILRV
jgi:hypothetical protein